MTLHVYNPEHDIALACNLWNFSLPKAARLTREKYWELPRLWAAPDDIVVNPDRLCQLSALTADNLPDRIEPWGWDRYIVRQLTTANPLLQSLCPTDDQLQEIRRMSSRQFAAQHILPALVATDKENLVGEAKVLNAAEQIDADTFSSNPCVLKSPWSCSGRGVRFATQKDLGWAIKIIREQGCIMQEPAYDNLLDFAMEFYATEGRVEYKGLNVFKTNKGKYISNLGKTQEEKFEILIQYISADLLWQIRDRIIELTTHLFKDKYTGPFGIDMMIVRHHGKTKVHPCVEMNLRRTMGNLL